MMLGCEEWPWSWWWGGDEVWTSALYTITQIQIPTHNYKYTNTNTQIPTHKYKYTNTILIVMMSGEPGVVSFISRSCPRLRHLCQNLGTNEPLHSTQLHKYKYQQDFGALPYIDLHVSLWYRLQHRLDKNTTIHTVEPLGRSEHTKQRQTGPAGLLTKTYY